MEKKFEIDPKLKKEINEEGWEAQDKESGAAILIGEKKEMPGLLEKLYTGEKTVDLGTYLRLHKNIILPLAEVRDLELKETIQKNVRLFGLFTSLYGIDATIKYIDKEGNVSIVKIKEFSNIAELDEKIEKAKKKFGMTVDNRVILSEELQNLGFVTSQRFSGSTTERTNADISCEELKEIFNKITKEEEKYQERLEKAAAEAEAKEKAEEFDF